jgi:hypothetical protein
MAITRESDLLTIAAIRDTKQGTTQILFHERQRIFTLNKRLSADPQAMERLRGARAGRRPLKVTVSTRRAEIQRIVEPSAKDLKLLKHERPALEKPQRIARLDLARIDPTTFNIADLYLKWPVFKWCLKTVPSYSKAKEIFDFCAQLSCHLAGPPAVQPCIPFQYVRDGCYARAHQMRRIILKRWGYCVEKVFSFATAGNDTLAVNASKWGGCCVEWWYHVAPLLRVQVKLKLPRGHRPVMVSLNLATVIDPGMFDKPVLLSTWLAAQENMTCNANAHVTSYSIQPGSAYTPSWGGGFNTDPNYTHTEATLLNYANLTTC